MFVKICGTTSEEDALLSVALGADAVGFIFAPSKRQVTATAVSDIVKRLPPEVMTVGVFRDDDAQRVVDQVLASGVRAVQLHGQETRKDIEFIRSKLPLTIIKVVAAGSSQVQKADKYRADMVMLDAPNPGSGQVYDWRLADGVPDGVKLIIAGGLNPENVHAAIESVQPWGVDVATGVEASPGRKDPRKLREFIKNAKDAHQRITELAQQRELQDDIAVVDEEPKNVRRDGSSVFDWELEGVDD
jgi:phosphoribosylanthranilate isomerase